jgi:hypothetical protein
LKQESEMRAADHSQAHESDAQTASRIVGAPLK